MERYISNIEITDSWLEQYEKIKDVLVSPTSFRTLFNMDSVDGKELNILEMGSVRFDTGAFLVRDPLVYLNKNEEPYFIKVPCGEYPLETLVAKIEEDHYRYVATRVLFSEDTPVIYREALKGDEEINDATADTYFGFNVDAGLASIVDVSTRDAYSDFVDTWRKDHPDKNIYDDFFADKFKESYEKNPLFQREAGDWMTFKINDEHRITMIQSGFGDGKYPVYIGFDENEKIVEVVIEYIYIKL